MLTKRIIPCLDIKDGRAVKGINFLNLRDAGDPVELAATYAQQGADELVFLDISATQEQRKTFAGLGKGNCQACQYPFYGRRRNNNGSTDVAILLEAGADKVSVNSAAVKKPDLINELTQDFGSQCIVLAIDARKQINQWIVHTHGGRERIR
jgi:cyclase